MITVSREKCSGCGTCAEICHESCMSVVDGEISIDDKACSTCAQCAAACPSQALSWDGIPTARFEPSRLPGPDQLDELFKERRTVRRFQDRHVDRSLLESLASFAAYAPTHAHDFRIIIIDDPETIRLMDSVLLALTRRVYRLLFKPRIIHALLRVVPAWMRGEFARAKPKLEAGIARGSGFGSLMPALVVIVGKKRVPLNLESAQYALYTMSLVAQVRGLGCRNLVGNQAFFNANAAVRGVLGLARNERIFGLAGFGYPATKFRNKVEGRSIPISYQGA